MRLKFSFVGGAAMLASLLAVPEAKADVIVLPNPEYYESITVGNPYSNSNFYQFQGNNLGSFQAPCAAGVGAPLCALIT